MFQSVIFDLDGTLLNSLGDLAEAGNFALAAQNFPVHPEERYKQMIGSGISTLIERMLPEESRTNENLISTRRLFDDYYQQHMQDHTRPYEGIPELLAALKQQNLSLGVLSNKDDEFAKELVQQYFPSIFDMVRGICDNRLAKPNPDQLISMQQMLNINSDLILYCGDSGVDMETACNANITACGVLWGFRQQDELISCGAKFLAKTPSDILDIVNTA